MVDVLAAENWLVQGSNSLDERMSEEHQTELLQIVQRFLFK